MLQDTLLASRFLTCKCEVENGVRLTLEHKLQPGLNELYEAGVDGFASTIEVQVSTPKGPLPCPPGSAWKVVLQIDGGDRLRLSLAAEPIDADPSSSSAPALHPLKLCQKWHLQLLLKNTSTKPCMHLIFTKEAPATPPGWGPDQRYSWPDMQPHFEPRAVKSRRGAPSARVESSSAAPPAPELPAVRAKQPNRKYLQQDQEEEQEEDQAPEPAARPRKAAKSAGVKHKAGAGDQGDAASGSQQSEQQGVMPWPAALAQLMSQAGAGHVEGSGLSMTALASLLMQAFEAGKQEGLRAAQAAAAQN
mmetsp:Transcript_27159/g.69119  ORF Transcript_27159/g.69119 Transcript_27159/m.69119 type:complete len:305 (-) Transcript_27159:198-1112(-)|eukprot:CAMPEP_0202860218 /NCGR_PEP_ID=MMETSP1391-20130828/2018_1 /ASSEMBLY_ACC=CAM_ASM_000867 /TAXON_ID=1034604 /ORGANISM="Chlamydomonas leiostraca, Strain SAG 11-49" /LENGTH=304 /DNA_ID=CAMNT_0049539359 /DNA_START=92 /DNA_END=1006 /DNA_ORIENTATION=+